MQILIADRDEDCLKTLEWRLGAEQFKVYGITEGDEVVSLGKLYDYDAIVLSETDDPVGLVLRSLRAAKVKTPILVITGIGGITERVDMLDAGADDVMTKPFHTDEVIARLNALVRRSRGLAESIITVGPVAINLSAKTAAVNGKALHVTNKQYHMLERLMLHKGVVQTKEQMMTHLYGGMDEPELKIIDVFICKLRQKLAAAGADGAIETVWGRGYLIRDPDAQNSPSMAPEIRDLAGLQHMGHASGQALPNHIIVSDTARHKGAL